MSNHQQTAEPADINGTLYVFASRVRCPKCSSTEHKTTRSIDNGDSTRTIRKRCKACDAAFVVVLE